MDSSLIKELRETTDAKVALWYTDDPRYWNTIIKRTAGSYDAVYTVSPLAVEHYRRLGVKNAQYLPVACDPTFHQRVELTSDERTKYECDVVFVGTFYRRRAQVVNELKRSGLRVRVYGDYWNYFWPGNGASKSIPGPEMVKAFNAAKIVLNVHADSDLRYEKVNTRTFEAAGCKSLVLTDGGKALDECFAPGKELIRFRNGREMVELAKYYVASERERQEIAQKAQIRAYRDHKYVSRLTKLLQTLN